jgi:capsular polysaccharide biosynthesis protein
MSRRSRLEFQAYYRLFTKRLWIIVATMILGLVGALLISRLQTPVYRSTVYLNMRPRRLDWGLQQTIKGLMRNYAVNVTSRDTALQIIEALDLDMTSDQLRGKLRVTPIESDFVLQLAADDTDPALAQAIAQTAAEKFVARIHDYMRDQDPRDHVELTIRDYALPGTLHRPNLKINLAAGGLLGILLGTLIVLVLRWMEGDVIASQEDVERYMGLTMIGAIPEG